jgi:hypothetical protein
MLVEFAEAAETHDQMQAVKKAKEVTNRRTS